jgi:hypothetical protein
LLLNTTGDQNTAVGTDALVYNDSGTANTAAGWEVLLNNTDGSSNTAIGSQALISNVDGADNTALGVLSLSNNSSGANNTALGSLALESNVSNSNHVCVGRMAGSGITSVDNNIILGHHNGVHSVFGQESNRCYIDNIHGSPVSAGTAAVVMVDSDGRLGTVTADGPQPGGFSPKGIPPKSIPDAAEQAMLNLKVQELEATVAQLKAQLKEQAFQIQRVGAQLELSKAAPQTVLNNN